MEPLGFAPGGLVTIEVSEDGALVLSPVPAPAPLPPSPMAKRKRKESAPEAA